ncbi:GNAT family N-acetyltransferase [Thermomonas sp. HDW16]|uniref:GNAT family N-acetyltransferase n=1 Tax=Thermomonas sp. HDW16 TaxID=2714945 RepID=UPI00140DD698|nr:GNAT family N-acetyltransferase [Thermomonas sp. HDW16]QIL21595.1 GNAT family N-acetyltransferase [Thermomonas sp. HDW16]
MNTNAIRIVGFEPRWRADFAALNIEWLEQWFEVEAYDREVLQHPERYILAGGGYILFAVDEADRALGTVALMHLGDGIYELTKMAVSPEARGLGIGRLLMDEALRLYRSLDARELFLESSSKLAPALALYESVGFRHHPAPRAGSHYARADVHMIWEPQKD